MTEEFITSMKNGVKILLDDETTLRKHPHGLYVTTRPCKVKKTGDNSFSIVLTQGFNRQIRRMCKALGYSVTSLVRTRLLYLRLGDLKSGQTKMLNGAEAERLRRTVYESSQADAPEYPGAKHAGTMSQSGRMAGSSGYKRVRTSSQPGGSGKPQPGGFGKSHAGGAGRSHTEAGSGRRPGKGGKGKTGTGRRR